MTGSLSVLKCISCGAEYEPREPRYRCACGDLLEVRHDLERIKAGCADLRELFARRLSETALPYSSGVWRYHEIILPDLPIGDIVSKAEGNTRMYSFPLLSRVFGTRNLFLKHEGENPTLSFKDRGMTAGVSWAKHLGMKVVACASTGDTSAAMAAYAAQVEGMKGVVFLPENKISIEQLAQAISYGAMTLAIDTDFDGCMKLVQKVTESHPVYLLNSMNSFRIEGQKAIGMEAIQQLGWKVPDWFVVPVGNAGNISAIGKGLLEMKELGLIDRVPRLAGIQAAAADPLYLSYRTGFEKRFTVTASPTLASAIRIGDPVSRDKASAVIMKTGGVVGEVSEEELMEAKMLADRSGIAVCPNSGVALAGLRKLRASGTIGEGESVVVVLTAHGAKFSQTGVDYHTGRMERPKNPCPNAPVSLPADYKAVVRAMGLARD